jgi:hypothetical protein
MTRSAIAAVIGTSHRLAPWLAELLERHRVSVERGGGIWCCSPEARVIVVPPDPITTDHGAATVLHEYGHIVFESGAPVGSIRNEVCAWMVAMVVAGPRWTPAMTTTMARALGAYAVDDRSATPDERRLVAEAVAYGCVVAAPRSHESVSVSPLFAELLEEIRRSV